MATAFAGLGVQALAHLVLAWRGSPLVREHRATLTFLSALVGDGLILPGVNAVLAMQLRRWAEPLRPGMAVCALAVGAAVTAAIHLAQGWLRLINWSMPRPFRWNWIGWYHAAFMWSEFAYLAYAALLMARQRRAGRQAASWLLGAVVGGVLGFAALVAYDYRRGTR